MINDMTDIPMPLDLEKAIPNLDLVTPPQLALSVRLLDMIWRSPTKCVRLTERQIVELHGDYPHPRLRLAGAQGSAMGAIVNAFWWHERDCLVHSPYVLEVIARPTKREPIPSWMKREAMEEARRWSDPEDVFACKYCHADTGEERHFDHGLPISRGGFNHPMNIHVACPTCNFAKGMKTVAEFGIRPLNWKEQGCLMARIRTIKPEFFKHEELYEAEQETGLPLRLAFAGLWTICDREGRFEWRPRRIKTDVLPYDEVDFSRVLDALATRGWVVRYTIAGREYGVVPSFSRHQVINNREKPSELPEPPQAADPEPELTRAPRVADACHTRQVHAQAEGEREGEGEREESDDDDSGASAVSSGGPEWLTDPARRTHRERLLVAMGLDASGLNANGQRLGGGADMDEARTWSEDLGLTESEQIAVVLDWMSRKPDGKPPKSFGYFTEGMQEKAGWKAKAKLTPLDPPPERRASARPDPDRSYLTNLDFTRKAGGTT